MSNDKFIEGESPLMHTPRAVAAIGLTRNIYIYNIYTYIHSMGRPFFVAVLIITSY